MTIRSYLEISRHTFLDMPDPTDIPQFELPSNALIDALLADPASIEKWSLAVKLRDQRDKGRASLKEHHESLNKALEEVARNDVDEPCLVSVFAASGSRLPRRGAPDTRSMP